MSLLAVDIGTTHVKAGLFDAAGALISLASRANPVHKHSGGYDYYAPQELWAAVISLMREVLENAPGPVQAIGISSMAETGLLVDALTSEPRTVFFPWFDTSATPQAERLRSSPDAMALFCRRGVRPAFKCSLARLLWLRDQNPAVLEGAIWLDAAGYVVFRLTGSLATDPTLAGRTYAFKIDEKAWDGEFLESLGISASLFPPILPSGAPVGGGVAPNARLPNLRQGTPVAICGHDHICAAFAASLAAGGLQAGVAFDSLGTAEPLVGVIPERRLGEADYRSGLAYGCHVLPNYQYWIGGLSTSGGSIEWLRAILGDPPLAYEELEALLPNASSGPNGLIYFPYLAGSGSPHNDSLVRGAFVGLNSSHSRGDLYRAVLEGAAFELEFIRRTAESATGVPIRRIVAAGGGARNAAWMQIKADVYGHPIEILGQVEATLLGAAALAGLGCKAIPSLQAFSPSVRLSQTYQPDEARRLAYQQLYEHGFLPFQEPLRAYFRNNP